jgi:hypothetical protein
MSSEHVRLAGVQGRHAVVPAWCKPDESIVRLARRRTDVWRERTGGEARYEGIAEVLDWVAGVRDLSPVSGLAEAATPARVLAEVLAAEYALEDPPMSGEEYERRTRQLGQGVFYPTETSPRSHGTARSRYVVGVLETLRWLLGELDRPPITLPQQQ